jgi:hypothetical protein
MQTDVTRRRFLAQVAGGGAALAISGAGCAPPPATPSGVPAPPVTMYIETPPPEPIELVFAENANFYATLDRALRNSTPVTVTFDGSVRIGRDSRFFNEYLAAAENAQDIYETIDKHDDQTGREQLKLAFEDTLLDHEEVTVETKKPNGEVIEPGTIVLVLGLAFIAAVTAIVISTPVKDRPFNIEMVLSPFRVELRIMSA